MESQIEMSDTLKISKERGFPSDLTLEGHVRDPMSSKKFLGPKFDFWNKGARRYPTYPDRVFLVEEIPNGTWLYWGNARVIYQTINADGNTEGQYQIIKIYDPEFQKRMTVEESPEDRSYFFDKPTSFTSASLI
jgi:hypothetical protein